MKSIIIIPARLNSTRLPNKVILDLNGKPVIQRTFEACCLSLECDEVYIAVDDSMVEAICKKFTDKVIMTNTNHQSGTSRIVEAFKTINADIVVNVQGDEPFINPATIDALIKSLKDNPDSLLASAYSSIHTKDELENPNVVKVITDIDSNAIYFSRYTIPYNRDNKETEPEKYKKHIGIYGYKKEFLINFNNLQPSFLEEMERLEQLRFLENGFTIRMIEVNTVERGIDTPEDIEWARSKFKTY